MRRRIVASVTSWCLLLLSLGGPLFAAQAGAGQPAPPPPYKLQPGDQVQISVDPQHGPYDRQVVILPDGRIYYPVVGEIVAAGLTVPQLRDALQQGLMKELRNFTVTVIPTIVHPPGGPQNRATITGEVRQPSVLSVQDNTTIIEALQEVGGPTQNADLSRVSILRNDLTTLTVDLNTPAGKRVLLQGGDIIQVPSLEENVLTASALGEVQRPGPVSFKPGATLLDLLKAAGGPTRDADLAHSLLRRPGEEQPIAIDMDQLWTRGELSLNLRLVQGDVLVVPKNTNNVVYLLGGIQHPDAFPIRPGDRLIDILTLGGSPTQDANLSKVTITRTLPGGGTTTKKLDLKKMRKGGDVAVAQMPVEAGDIIVVPTTGKKLTSQERLGMITQVISTFALLANLAQLNRNNRNNNRNNGSGGGIGGP